MTDSFKKAWYDHVDYSRRIPKDSIRLPGYTGPSGQDRRSHFRPNMMWLDRNPMDEGGWQQGVRREVSRGRKTDSPSGWAVSGSDGYTDEEKRRYKLDLALARLPLELNRPLELGEILGLVEHKDDLQYLVDTGVMPSALQGRDSLEQMMTDVKDGTKSIKDLIGEAIGDGWVPPRFAGEAKDEYYMPHVASDRLTMLDRMRAVINARLMDVPRKQLLTLVDDKSMAPKVMEDWHDHTKPVGSPFGHGDWSGHTPRTAGALVRDTKNLSRLDGLPNIFDDIMGRIGNQPELKAMFRRLLSSEAADLLNTMDDRRELDRIDPRGMPFSNAPAWMGPVQGPMEDFGDVEIRGHDPFSEEFQIMNRSNDSFEDAWDVVKVLDPLSINPLLQTARGMVKDPISLEESYGLPAGFIGQDGKFVIQPEKRLDPLRAKRAFDSEPARGFNEEQRRVMRALGMDPDNMVGGNDALSLGGRDATGSHPLEFTASNERRQTTGKRPVEWEDLTIRPTFGEMHLKPGDPIEEYEIPPYEYIDNRTGRPIRKPSSILQSKWPYFGNRDWPKVKGLEGMGWHPREGSLGHLSWNRGTGDWDLGPDFPGIKTPSHPLVDDLTIDPSARRQGLGGDLVDLFRYSLPALRMTGRRLGIKDELMRNPMETVSARPFWDKYFQSRWTGDDTHIPSDVLDASFESPDPHQGVIRMPPGSKIPGLMGSIKDDDMFLSHRPGLMNQFDAGTPRTLAPLPPENRFNMALTRPRELLDDIGDSSDLDSSDRMNRWLARQLIREQGKAGGKGRGFKRGRGKGKKGKFTRLSEEYPHIVRDL